MKQDKRIERNSQSILALRDLLREVASNPKPYLTNDSLLKALHSQGNLAKFNDISSGIHASSLNTVKRMAEAVIEGGFDTIDRLRLAAREAVTQEETKGSRSSKRNKLGLEKRLKELELENKFLREDLAQLTLAFQKSLVQGRHYALSSDKSAVLALCDREQRIILDTLSLLKRPISTNFSKFRDE